jgi:hypothetical protein
MPQRILKLLLAIVATVGGVRGGLANLAQLANGFPQLSVIKLAAISLPSGVINILNVGKKGNFFHKEAIQSAEIKAAA